MIRFWTLFAGWVGFALLFVVDFFPPWHGTWQAEPPHTQTMGPLRLWLHDAICRSLDELNARLL